MANNSICSRRDFVKIGATAAGLALAPGATASARADSLKGRIKVGTVTYNIARDWDLPTLIKNCKSLKLEGVELRTTHKHGVEPTLNAAQRADVKKRFLDSPVVLWCLGTTCEFHSPDQAKVKQQISIARDFCKLAHDTGARAIKVRPNGLPRGVPVEKTLEQIGKGLAECGRIGADWGVEIQCEVHGGGSCEPPNMATIMKHCNHPNVGVTWNSNGQDVKNGSVKESYALLKQWIKSVHLKDLSNAKYPYRELFTLLKADGYNRYALAEIGGSSDPMRVMKYFVALFNEMTR